MKKGNRKPLSPKLRAELKTLAAMPEREIDTVEMPLNTDWSHAVRRPFYRPIKRAQRRARDERSNFLSLPGSPEKGAAFAKSSWVSSRTSPSSFVSGFRLAIPAGSRNQFTV